MNIESSNKINKILEKDKGIFFTRGHRRVSIKEYSCLIQEDAKELASLLKVIDSTIIAKDRMHHLPAVFSLRTKCNQLKNLLKQNFIAEFDQALQRLNDYCNSIMQ